MYIRGKLRWIYPRKGRLVVYYKRKGRPIAIQRGRLTFWWRRKWIGFGRRKTPVKLRLRFRGRWRYVVKRLRRWYIRYRRRYYRVTLRGRRFGIRIGGRWRYVPARRGTLQIRYRKLWRRVRNCCNKLRAVLFGRLRRIRLRKGKARVRGRNGWKFLRRGRFNKFRLGRIRGTCCLCKIVRFGHVTVKSWIICNFYFTFLINCNYHLGFSSIDSKTSSVRHDLLLGYHFPGTLTNLLIDCITCTL